MTKNSQDTNTLEKELQQLEKIVAKMESTELSLESALAEFEKGVTCVKTCQELLKNAEQRIEVLTQENNSND